MVVAQQDIGKTFVVAQQHIIRRTEFLDKLGFEQQSLGLAAGRHDGHRPRLRYHPLQPARQPTDLYVIGHPIAQGARLADIEYIAARILHPVYTGLRGQCVQSVADRLDAGF